MIRSCILLENHKNNADKREQAIDLEKKSKVFSKKGTTLELINVGDVEMKLIP